MIGTVLVCAGLLGVAGWDEPKTVGTGGQTEGPVGERLTAALAEYNARAARTAQTANAQWALALWCEKKGLKPEANSHLSAVVRLDPTREAAWRKLGFTKRDGRWLNPDEVADDDAQKAADKVWAPRLKAIHKDIHAGGKRQESADDALLAVDDPRAVPSVFREFGNSGATDQLIAVRALGHIPSPLSSRLLAMLAIYGRTPEVRRQATESLRSRDAEDYLDVLVGLMNDPVKYQVVQVGGPGSPGVLTIDGQQVNVRRVYYPPPPPNVAPRPGDLISYDANGLPVIDRPLVGPSGYSYTPRSKGVGIHAFSLYEVHAPAVRFSQTDALVQSQNAVASARAQLEADVAALDGMNEQRRKFNEVVIRAAKDATGKNGDTPADWRDALPKRKEYDGATETKEKPTVDDLVALDFRPVYLVQHLATWFKLAPAD